MARPGPAPKNQKHGHSATGWIDVVNVPYDGPGSERDLPETRGIQWLPQVEGWWEVVRVMPHCILWEATDWLFAIETAFMKQDYYSEYFGGTVHSTKATELRRREDIMGMTMEARRKNLIRYVDPIDAAGAEPDPQQDPQQETATSNTGVTPIGSAKSRRQQLAG